MWTHSATAKEGASSGRVLVGRAREEERRPEVGKWMPDANPSTVRIPPARPDQWRGPAPDAALGRRIAYLMAAAIISGIAGVAVAFVEPVLIIGGVLALAIGLVVLLQPFAGLLLYTCLFLLRPAELYPALAPLHLERVVGAATLAAMFLAQHRRDERFTIDGSRQTLLLFGFMAAVIGSIPFAYWRYQAVQGFIEVVKIAIFYLLVVHLVDTRKRLQIFIVLFSILILYIAGTAFVSYQQGTTFYAQGIDRAVGNTSVSENPNSLGTTIAAAIPLFLLLALRAPSRWMRLLFALGVPLLLSTLGVTGSRASILGFLGAAIYLWWTSRNRILVGIVGLTVLVAGFLILPEQYQTRYSSMTNSELDASSQGRVTVWKKGARMVIDRPLFGVGIDCFGTANAASYSGEGRRSYLRPHNLFVQVFAEVGLIGGLLFLAFMFEFLRTNRRTARKLAAAGSRWRFEREVLNALFAGFVVLLVTGLFGHSMLRRTWYLYAALGVSVWRLYLGDAQAKLTGRIGTADKDLHGSS